MSATEIATFVFLDLETTGLPWQERNLTKIIELSVVAATRQDIINADGELPAVRKLSFLLNPAREIHPKVSELTGLSQADLKDCPLFEERYEDLKKFLKPLARPICIVSHNGNSFDFKILRAEVKDARRRLPKELLCVDSLVAFRQIDRFAPVPMTNHSIMPSNPSTPAGDDDWPDLDLSSDDWQEIDEICERLSDVSTDPDSPIKSKMPKVKNLTIKPKKILQENTKQDPKVQAKPNTEKRSSTTTRTPYTLSALYQRLTSKEPVNAHRAECDCLMLLECVVATKRDFLPWADRNCQLLTEIQPLARYKQQYTRYTRR